MELLQFIFDTSIVGIDYLFVYFYCTIFFKKKTSFKNFLPYLVACAIINQLIYLVLNNLTIDIVLNLFYCFLLTYFFFSGSMLKKIIHSILFYLLIGLLTSFLLFIFNNILGLETKILFQFTYERVSFIIISKMFIFLILNIIKKVFNKNEIYDFNLPNKHQIIVVLLSIAIFICTLILFFICLFESNQTVKMLLMTVLAILFLINVIMFNVFYSLDNTLKENNSLKVISTINKIEKTNFDNLEKKQLIIQNIKHDLKNTLLTLQQYIQENEIEQAEKFLAKLNGEISGKSNYIKSGNRIVDSLLNYYSDLNEKIHFQTIIQMEYPIIIEEMDLIAILGNLLSNSVEATTKTLIEHESQIIYIRIKSTVDHVYLMVRNSFDSSQSNVKNFSTTKKSKEEHGFGMNQIKQTVLKNNGIFDIYVNNNEFIAKISFENNQKRGK